MKNSLGGIPDRFGNTCHTSAFGVRRSAFGVLFFLLAAAAAQAANVLTFQRSTPYTYVSTTGRVSAANFSIECWIRQTTAFDTENQIYCQDNGGTIGNGVGRMFFSTKNAKPFIQVSSTTLTGNTNLTLNTWYHFAITRDANGNAKMYIDGTLVGSAILSKDLPAGTSGNVLVSIGLLDRVKAGFRGDLADLRLWNTARSQTEIQDNRNRRLDGTESGLAHYWPLDEGIGAAVNDRAGNASGTISGATWSTNPALPIVTSGDAAWASATGGDWSVPSNWLDANPAQSPDVTAYFTNAPPSAFAVNNDLTGLRLGNLTVHGAAGHTFTGNALAFTNSYTASLVATTNGDHTFALPLQVSPFGLVASSATSAAFTFSQPISGPGGFTANPAASGGGTITLSAVNTYTGPTTSGSGTLSVPALADGGLPSPIGASSADSANLVLGPGTFRYTGPAATLNRGLTVNAGSRKAAILSLDADLTLTGPITNTAGALVKTGPGTLTYAAPVASLIGRQQSTDMRGQAPYPANGDAPANGFGCFTVANGKVVLGAHPAQTNFFNEEVTVGTYTTGQAGQETTGELEFAGGYHRFNAYLDIGYYNGTSVTAPTPLNPVITIKEGATVSANGMIIAFSYNDFGSAYPNARATLNIHGGTLTVDNDFRFGDQRGDPASPMHATVNITSGLLRHTGSNGTLRMGARTDAGGSADATLNLSGGLMDVANDIQMAGNRSTAVINLNGGTLRMRNLVHNTTNGTSRLVCNGGVLQPRMAGYTLNGLTEAFVGLGGARVDTSLAPYTVRQDLLHDPALGAAPDGGLVKTGTNTLTLSFTNATYTGVTAVNEGELRIGGNATQTVAVAALTVAPGAAVGFAFKTDGSSNDRLAVAQTASLASGSLIALTISGTELPFTKNGTYTLLSYAGADPSVAGLACANPAPGKSYSFAASSGVLTVTLGNVGAVWNTDADGAWSTAANWTTAPAPGDPVRFDEVITAPRTVAAAGQTAGGICFNSINAYTLAGSGDLFLSSGATLAVEQGAHTISAPLALADSAAVSLAPGTALTLNNVSGTALTTQGNGTLTLTAAPALASLTLNVTELGLGAFTVASPVALVRTTLVTPALNTSAELSGTVSGNAGLTKSGASTLTLTGVNTYNGVTRIDNGTLSVPSLSSSGQPGTLGVTGNAANLLIGAGTFRYTGPSNTVNRGLTLAAPQNRAAIIRVNDGSDITLTGWINSTSGSFIKTGPGTLRFAQPNTGNKLMTHGSPNEAARLNIGPNGESPTQGFSGVSVVDGKLSLGAPGQTNTLTRIFVGLFSSDSPGGETAGELELTDGVLNLNNSLLAVGRNNGTTTTAPAGLSSRLTVRGGIITNASHISLGYQNASLSGYNARPVMAMSGGTVVINNLLISESSGSKSTVTLTGGTLQTLIAARFALAANTESVFTLANDARFETVGAFDTQLGYGNFATSVATLRLNGGTLSTRNIVKAASALGTLYFNGGTLKPHTSGQTLQSMTAAYASTNGAVIDTSLAAYTVAQNILHDPSLGGADDGGLVKLGTNTLSLSGAGNTFNGPVDVREGLLQARLGATNDLTVATNGVFDALGYRATVGDLTGSGTLTNGVIAVTGTLDAGTNGAPAGARMSVQNLSLLSGSTFSCDWTTNALGHVTNDVVSVTGTLTAEGPGFVDFGRTEANPLPMPFTATLLSYGSLSGSFAGWKAVNTGLPSDSNVALVVTASNGLVTIEVRYGGSLLMLK